MGNFWEHALNAVELALKVGERSKAERRDARGSRAPKDKECCTASRAAVGFAGTEGKPTRKLKR